MSEERITVAFNTKPHSDKQRLLFNAFMLPGIREIWVCGGNKVGKTVSIATAAGSLLPIMNQGLIRWIAPYYVQSRVGFDYIRRMLPGEPYVRANESMMTLKMPHNDSRIEFFHGQNAKAQEGAAPSATALDEAAKLKEEVYYSAKTTTSVTEGPIMAFSTPMGQNWFYRKCMDARDEMLRAKREGRRPTSLYIHMPSTDNPHVSRAVIEDARRTMPDRLFRQQYLAEFIGSGAVFVNLHNCYYTDYMEMADTFSWYAPLHELSEVTVGVDWARINDYTVFTASEPRTRKLVAIWRMKQIPYPEQVKRLVTFCKRFKETLTIFHDKTGVGVALDDMLGQTDLPFRGITFTNASKNEMMVKLILAFEEVSYQIPFINRITRELDDLEVKTTALGLASYAAPDGEHDDIVMSPALSHVAMQRHSERDFSILTF